MRDIHAEGTHGAEQSDARDSAFPGNGEVSASAGTVDPAEATEMARVVPPEGTHGGTSSIRSPWWARTLGRLMAPWVELSQDPLPASLAIESRPVCYILEDYGLSNVLILDRACREAGLPSPLQSLPADMIGRRRSYLALSRRSAGSITSIPTLLEHAQLLHGKTHSKSLARLIKAHAADPTLDTVMVPVSILIGRAPQQANGLLSILFSENWMVVSRFRRLIALLLNGRRTYVHFGAPVSLRPVLDEQMDAERTVRKVSRLLRTHFRRIRTLVVGPDLSTRRLLIHKVLNAGMVRSAIEDQAKRDKSSSLDAWKKAHSMAYEIAADYSPSVVRIGSSLLSWVWNRIYRGVSVNHLEQFKHTASGHEVVYVPSHRSHMDDLLLPYVLYSRGIVAPHIVAGANLNLPLVGPLLRKGGAFFIRRSIRGSMLYSAVFSEYMAQLVSGGHSLAYFIEGGRSRTGRLLAPKGGTLAMTVRAYLRQPSRPLMFQPVYISYEKLMEGRSYLEELSGRPKQAESAWQLIGGISKVLRSNYGKVTVNFGAPILLNEVLAEHASSWQGSPIPDDQKPQWLVDTIAALAQRINVHVNAAADVNPINLLAMAMLSTPKHAMSESDLIGQITLSKLLLERIPYSDHVTVSPLSSAQIVAHGKEIGMLNHVPHPLGDVFEVRGEQAILLSYFRNNVLHLFTAPGWIACCFQNNDTMAEAALLRIGREVYPFLQAELFLPWSEDEFEQRLHQTIEVFLEEGLLSRRSNKGVTMLSRRESDSDEVFRLRTIGNPLQQAFERYHITISILVKNGRGLLGAGELETLCQQAAQRLSLLYASAAPEFFDKGLYRGFIQKLRQMKLIWSDDNSKLVFDDRLEAWARDAMSILSRDLRHSIEKVSPMAHGESCPPPPPVA
ncbi:glycerol-3-phosphate 1-O-acyltransferase PlsB [Stenotrophomonas pavanii]|uniref:glycerol-3-phosphate 1-O-acyltransferase PlsB n=1 Tax=Stenotrophomonas pavanii TaxID=487698 RepID=UPI0039C724B8